MLFPRVNETADGGGAAQMTKNAPVRTAVKGGARDHQRAAEAIAMFRKKQAEGEMRSRGSLSVSADHDGDGDDGASLLSGAADSARGDPNENVIRQANADAMAEHLQRRLKLQDTASNKQPPAAPTPAAAPSVSGMTNGTNASCVSSYSNIMCAKARKKKPDLPAQLLEEAITDSRECEERLTRCPDLQVVAESMAGGLRKMRRMTKPMLDWWESRMHKASTEDDEAYERYTFCPPINGSDRPVSLAEGLEALRLVLQPDGPGGMMDMMPALRANQATARYLFPADGKIRLALYDTTQMFYIAWCAQMSRLPNNANGDTQRNSAACLALARRISCAVLRMSA